MMASRREQGTIGSKAPPFSIVKVFSTLKEKKMAALEDPEQGPHVHLTLLLATILVVSFTIIVITQFVL